MNLLNKKKILGWMVSPVLTAILFFCDPCHARPLTLDEVTQTALKQNLLMKEKLIETHQAQGLVHYNRMSLLPKLDLYSLINTGGSFFGIAGLIEDVAPFLVPANWYRINEAEISASFQKKSYKALWANEVLATRSLYLTIVSDIKSLAVYDTYKKDLEELQGIAETRDQFGGDRLGALEMLLAQKNMVMDDQISLEDIINQQFYSLTQMTQIDPKAKYEFNLDSQVRSTWTFLNTNAMIDLVERLSPEVKSFDDLLAMLAQLKNEVGFSFFGSSPLSKGVAGGVFDDLPLNGGWGFSTQALFTLTKTKEALLKVQQTGVKETLKRQLLRLIDQNNFLIEKEKNLNERIVHLNQQWEILLDRLQFGKNAPMDELIANRQALAETKIALITLNTLRSQLNDKADRMLWWDVYNHFPQNF